MTVVVQDFFSGETMELVWFNAYPNLGHKLRRMEQVIFLGVCNKYNGKWQVVNAQIVEATEEEIIEKMNSPEEASEYNIRYPTVNGVNSRSIKSILGKIPDCLWKQIGERLSPDILKKNQFPDLGEAFNILHGRLDCSKEKYAAAKRRLVYEEFFQEQVKLFSRKQGMKKKEGIKCSPAREMFEEIVALFPYKLTDDQIKSINEISAEMISGHPMMKLLQGDVGCGKTSVALAATWIAHQSGYQTAFMCPTESLAIQHFSNISEILNGRGMVVEIIFRKHACERKITDSKKIGEWIHWNFDWDALSYTR